MNEQVEVKRFKHIQGIAAPTAILIEALKGGVPGNMKTDAELTALCKKDTRPSINGRAGSGYQNLASAIRYVSRVHGVDWNRQKKEDGSEVGYIKCLSPVECDTFIQRRAKIARRHTRRTLQICGNVPIDELPPDKVQAFQARYGQQRTLLALSGERVVARMVKQGTDNPTSLNKLLENIKGADATE